MNKVNISHVSNMHNQWLRTLTFYKSEIGILRDILTEIAGKNTGGEAMKQVEHFENFFTVQQSNIDTLAHRINENVSNMSAEAEKAQGGYISGELKQMHDSLGDQTDREQKIMTDAIVDFRKFAAQWM